MKKQTKKPKNPLDGIIEPMKQTKMNQFVKQTNNPVMTLKGLLKDTGPQK